jgi:hypothetical protein
MLQTPDASGWGRSIVIGSGGVSFTRLWSLETDSTE